MTVENATLTAPKLWGKIIQRNPNTIVAITGAHYFPDPHGAASRNIPLPEHKGMLLEQDLLEERFPDVEQDHRVGTPFPKRTSKPVFAVSSPVYVWTGDAGDPADQKVWAKTICYENEANLRQMQKWKLVRPKAMLMVDFDCEGTPENIRKISDILQRDNSKSRYVLKTGNGVHVVDEELIEPIYYPRNLGKLISDFVPTAPPQRRHIIEAFGNDLQKQWWSPEKLRKWSWDALRTFKHYDDTTGPGIPFMLDMRHAAHSIDEYLRFMTTGTGGWGYLRISEKSSTDQPPLVIARQRPRRNIEFLQNTTVRKMNLQPLLLQ